MANVTPDLNSSIGGTSFKWKDALFSQTAASNGLLASQYTIPESIKVDIENLFVNVLQPLKDAGKQFTITNVYRSPATNSALKPKPGSTTSQHMKGQAADIVGLGATKSSELYYYITNNLPYDQIIWEKGTLPPSGQPNWVHVSFKSIGNRAQQLVYDGTSYSPNTTEESASVNVSEGTKEQDKTNTNKSEEIAPDFAATFEQIETNVNNIELSDTEATWGKRTNPSEDSDWIGLKQYLLYLTSRFSPQSLFPFIELIPALHVDSSNISADAAEITAYAKGEGLKYTPHGDIPKQTQEEYIDAKNDKNYQKKAEQLLAKAKFIKELPPGFNEDRFNLGAQTSNQVSNMADLLSLDPFQEGLKTIDSLSPSGKKIKEQRNIGVRAYGQLVLSPSAIPGVASKPGAIGFTELEVQAGSQSDNGLALITMKLVDVQGNKFTDINSPWAFIYDVRPGSIGGDFYFRYGWQIRVPDPNDKDDMLSRKFWNHEGWKVFGDGVRNSIKSQILPQKQLITLTQSLNLGPLSDNDQKEDNKRIALFDEGIEFSETEDLLFINRKALNDKNYVKLSILNPELSLDDKGAITATLQFRTTGAITKLIPLEYALTTKHLFSSGNITTLGELLIAVTTDMDTFGFKATKNPEEKSKALNILNQSIALKKDRIFNDVFIIGPEKGGNTGTIHPDSIKIKVSKQYLKQLMNPVKESGLTLIRWFRQVLQDNDTELQSAATGSGAGINATWIFVTTQKIDADKNQQIIKQSEASAGDANSKMINLFTSEKDVFSFRFQGSLVEKLQIIKTDSPNAMKIAADFAVGGYPTNDSEPIGLDVFTNPVTAVDRKRNLTVIFSQMQNCDIDCLAHPWIGPGKRIYVKGMGFYDGEYICLQVTHKLQGHKFTSNIQGARILLQSTEKEDKIKKDYSVSDGNGNFSQEVSTQKK